MPPRSPPATHSYTEIVLKPMYVMGLNSVFHESAACLLDDGRLVAAAEEERFSRVKHAKKPRLDNPDELPFRAMQYCLDEANIDVRQIGHIGYSSDPSARRRLDAQAAPFWPSAFADNIERVPDALRSMGFEGDFSWVDHHLAHAASAFFGSEFEDAAVLAIDGIGDDKTTASYSGTGMQLRLVQYVKPPHSLGFLWELVSMYLGFDIYDATKIMGLAAYGDPQRFASQFDRLVTKLADGQFSVNRQIVRFDMLDYLKPTGYFGGLEKLFGVKKRTGNEELRQDHMDIAACLQDVTDDVVLNLADHLHKVTGANNLCLAGGVTLNCVTNERVFDRGPFDRLYVQPAAHDAGTALGAATYIWHHVLGNERRGPMSHAYWGPEFSSDEIEAVLRRRNLRYERTENVERDVARLLSEGHIVGFFQGRMEIGPRALGNRSLLADPRHPGMRDMLNQKVKHREYFRPFAPSVLAEEAHQWFEIGKETSASDFMLMAYSVPERLRGKIPAVVHEDGTSRVQTVSRQTNPRFHRLISEFQAITGVPIVLNTSFNDSEPIVCSPDDAVDTFLKTQIDYLAVGDFLVAKKDNAAESLTQRSLAPLALPRLCPDVHAALDRTLSNTRLSRIDGLTIITDRLSYCEFDQVLPMFVEQQFFLDEMPRERIRDARVLEIGLGSGVLSIAAARAGAASVVGLETSARARAFAGLNILLNDCEDRIDIREGHDDVFQPVSQMQFDYVMSNPPFVPVPADARIYRHSDAGPLGIDMLEKILAGLDAHLADAGCAQIVAICPGTRTSPRPVCEMASRLLSGATTIRVNPMPGLFAHSILWLVESGAIDKRQSVQMARDASRQGITHTHLCMIHYEKGGSHGVSVVPSRKTYRRWHAPTSAIEF
jgi:carbamoyltransferase